jgi:hypothetical protein
VPDLLGGGASDSERACAAMGVIDGGAVRRYASPYMVWDAGSRPSLARGPEDGSPSSLRSYEGGIRQSWSSWAPWRAPDRGLQGGGKGSPAAGNIVVVRKQPAFQWQQRWSVCGGASTRP